jgi:hypothetical protein
VLLPFPVPGVLTLRFRGQQAPHKVGTVAKPAWTWSFLSQGFERNKDKRYRVTAPCQSSVDSQLVATDRFLAPTLLHRLSGSLLQANRRSSCPLHCTRPSIAGFSVFRLVNRGDIINDL